MTVHKWWEKYHQGLQGEAQLDQRLRPYYLVTEATREQQREGVDRMVTDISDWSTFAVEYKTDSRARETGNAYVETVSVMVEGQVIKHGWAITSRADVLLYYVDGLEVYVIRMVDLRRRLSHWARHCRTVAVYNEQYQGQGILVPLPELATISTNIISMS